MHYVGRVQYVSVGELSMSEQYTYCYFRVNIVKSGMALERELRRVNVTFRGGR